MPYNLERGGGLAACSRAGEMLAYVVCLNCVCPRRVNDCPILWGSQLPGLWGVPLSWEGMMYLMSQNEIQGQGTKCPQMNVPRRGLIGTLWAGGYGGNWARVEEKRGVCLVPRTVL